MEGLLLFAEPGFALWVAGRDEETQGADCFFDKAGWESVAMSVFSSD